MASLFAAFVVAWTILMTYVLTLAARQRRLARQLQSLETQEARGSETGVHVR